MPATRSVTFGHPTTVIPQRAPLRIEHLLREILDQIGPDGVGDAETSRPHGPGTVVLDVCIDEARYRLVRYVPVSARRRYHLSPREQEIVRLVCRGNTNRAIAAILDVSPWTVSTHLRRIFGKLDVGSRAELASNVARDGLIAED